MGSKERAEAMLTSALQEDDSAGRYVRRITMCVIDSILKMGCLCRDAKMALSQKMSAPPTSKVEQFPLIVRINSP